MPRTARSFVRLALLATTLVLLGGCFRSQAPVANITLWVGGTTCHACVGTAPLVVEYDGTASHAPSGIVLYHWDFGDGHTSAEATGYHTYADAAEYTVTLTVMDADGRSATATAVVSVQAPDVTVWICDEALACVYKLDVGGAVLATYPLPYTQPHGLTLAEVGQTEWLYVACANEGSPRLVRIDPETGDLDETFNAPSTDPLLLASADFAQWGECLWLIDGFTGNLYMLDSAAAWILDVYGAGRLRGVPPVLVGEPLLTDPQGLDCTWDDGDPYLWYVEGATERLYKIRITPREAIVRDIQLQVETDPVDLSADLFPIAAMDMQHGEVWVIESDANRLTAVDPTTGARVRTIIPELPGSRASGLDVR